MNENKAERFACALAVLCLEYVAFFVVGIVLAHMLHSEQFAEWWFWIGVDLGCCLLFLVLYGPSVDVTLDDPVHTKSLFKDFLLPPTHAVGGSLFI